METEKSNRDARMTAPFADRDYEFRLAWGELRMLQEALDRGPIVTWAALMSSTWRVEDISETIRCGLIGGGMTPVKAKQMVVTYVESRPPMENLKLAQEILSAGINGAADEPDVGEDVAANPEIQATESTISRMAS